MPLISRAPLSKIEGWTIPWDSSFGSDFNDDFQVTTDETVFSDILDADAYARHPCLTGVIGGRKLIFE